MKKFAIAGCLVLTFVMSGCKDEGIEVETCSDVSNKTCERTVEYRGATLYCVASDDGESVSLSCDFQRFYAENNLLTHP